MRHLLAKWLRGGRQGALARTEAGEPPEDARAVFTDIYRRRAWVSPTADRDLYSGPGSDEAFARPYADMVRRFAAEHGVKTIVDLGCGDFRVGQLIAGPPFDYVGVDVVDDVIDYSRRHYQRDGVRFLRRDIARDELPDGDLCLVREVFQHLSNRQIAAALARMGKYRLRLVSDREPSAAAALTPNLDRPQGAESRTDLVSALRFDRSPFNQPNVELVLEIPAPTRMLPDSTIKTFLITG
jgi:SAM-dependent methyltransferase